jgi:GNAT superfamily N-acetyltransferase
MTFAPLTHHLQDQWANLLATCFDRQPEHMQCLLTWLYGLGEMIAWGAWEHDQLVGQYSCLLRPVRVGETRLLAGMSINMAVHPDWRGRGLVKQMARPVYERLQEYGGTLGIGFSNAAGVNVDRHSQQYHYQVIGQMQSMIGPLRSHRVAPLQLSDHLPAFDSSVISGSAHFEKSARYFQQRYLAHPFRSYRYAVWLEADETMGLVIYRDIGMSGVALLDAWGVDLPELLKRWSTTLRRLGKRFVHVLATPSSNLRCALSQITPLIKLPYTRNPHYLTVKPLTESLPASLLDFQSWDCVGGDVL